MNITIPNLRRKINFIICLGCFTILFMFLFQLSVQADLPPRPPLPQERTEDEPDEPVGALIELQVWPTNPALWTVVQWQDGTGQWHPVEGWQGHLDSGLITLPTQGQLKRWWVEPRNFGQGLFRWQVYAFQGGDLLTQSDPFHLPDAPGETVLRVVSLP